MQNHVDEPRCGRHGRGERSGNPCKGGSDGFQSRGDGGDFNPVFILETQLKFALIDAAAGFPGGAKPVHREFDKLVVNIGGQYSSATSIYLSNKVPRKK